MPLRGRIPLTTFIAAIALACAILCPTCRPLGKEKPLAETAVSVFHRRLDAEQYQLIYLESDAEFKAATKETEAIEYLRALHREFGRLKRAELKDWRVDVAVGRSLVHLRYETEFERGLAVEEFTWSVYDKRALLLNYNANSTTFRTR